MRDFKTQSQGTEYLTSMNKCWGKPKRDVLLKVHIKQTATGFEAGVSYKDTYPLVVMKTDPDNLNEN